uniref:SLED domain-containing protein n=1 Tax=Rhabditophanes sp. KR3021 TaxID=114890 RepID=A0AC35TKB8_9BILA
MSNYYNKEVFPFNKSFPEVHSPALFHDLSFVHKPIVETIMRPGDKIIISLTGKHKDCEAGRFINVIADTVTVILLDLTIVIVPVENVWIRSSHKDECLVIDKITDHVIKETTDISPYTYIDQDKNLFQRLCKEKCLRKISSLIETGKFVLYMDKQSMAHYAEIVAVEGAFILIKLADGECKLEPIRSASIKPLNSLSKYHGHILYKRSNPDTAKLAFSNPLSKLVFWKDQAMQHEITKGMELEIICPFTRTSIFIGFISSVVNEIMFEVTIIEHLDNKKNRKILCDRDCEFLLPRHFCETNHLRLSKPFESMTGASYKQFKKEQKMCGFVKMGHLHLPNLNNDIPEFTSLEVFDGVNLIMHQATIVKAVEHLLFIVKNDSNTMKPLAYSCRSNLLFPVNTSVECSIVLNTPASPHYIESRRFSHERDFEKVNSESPMTYFGPRKPDVLPALRDPSIWSPVFYINAQCNVGPFLKKDVFIKGQRVFQSGPIHEVIQLLAKTTLNAAENMSKNKLVQIWTGSTASLKYNKNDSTEIEEFMHTIRPNNKLSLTLRCCYTAKDFPNFLKAMMFRLNCCPNLVSLLDLKNEECPCKCKNVVPWYKNNSKAHAVLQGADFNNGPSSGTRGKRSVGTKRGNNQYTVRNIENEVKKRKIEEDFNEEINQELNQESQNSDDLNNENTPYVRKARKRKIEKVNNEEEAAPSAPLRRSSRQVKPRKDVYLGKDNSITTESLTPSSLSRSNTPEEEQNGLPAEGYHPLEVGSKSPEDDSSSSRPSSTSSDDQPNVNDDSTSQSPEKENEVNGKEEDQIKCSSSSSASSGSDTRAQSSPDPQNYSLSEMSLDELGNLFYQINGINISESLKSAQTPRQLFEMNPCEIAVTIKVKLGHCLKLRMLLDKLRV